MYEQQAQNDQRSRIGIIGGGKVGLQLLNLFSTSQLTRVAYVVDRDHSAPAMVSAKQQNIPTFTDIEQAIHSTCVDYVFEVTGVEKVLLLLKQYMADCSAQLVTHDMASVILRVVEENRQRSAQIVKTDILEIKKEISSSLDTMVQTLDGIKETTNDLRYLALNARIEAARAGDQGRGFDVVAQQVEQSAQDVRVMTGEIEDVNRRISAVSNRIDESLQKMR